jgi:hypothetical protein
VEEGQSWIYQDPAAVRGREKERVAETQQVDLAHGKLSGVREVSKDTAAESNQFGTVWLAAGQVDMRKRQLLKLSGLVWPSESYPKGSEVY